MKLLFEIICSPERMSDPLLCFADICREAGVDRCEFDEYLIENQGVDGAWILDSAREDLSRG